MTLYSNEIRRYIHTRDWPKGLLIDTKEIFDEFHKPLYLQMILYRDNFNQFDGEDQLRIAQSVRECMEKIRKDGVPIYLEVARGSGERVIE